MSPETPAQALLKNPELVEGPFRPAGRGQGPECTEGQRTGRKLAPEFDALTGLSLSLGASGDFYPPDFK